MRRVVLGVLTVLLVMPAWATTEVIHSVLHVKSSDWAGVRFVRLSDFQPKTTVDCPCKCPCSEGKPCDCKKCECKDCPGKPKPQPRYGYKEARLDAIKTRAGLTVWVGMSPPRLRSSSIVHVREELGWVNPWGQQVNEPCKLEFYYQDGKIWLLESTGYRAPTIVQRAFRSANC